MCDQSGAMTVDAEKGCVHQGFCRSGCSFIRDAFGHKRGQQAFR